MARAEDITWTGETFSSRALAEKYAFPVFALITKGSSSINVIENLAPGKIVRIHSVISQRRILVENDKGQFLAFPEEFKVKFGVKEKTGKNKRKTLKDVTKRYLLPATVTSDKNAKWPNAGKNQKETFDKAGKMVVIAAYTEKFLKLNIIMDGVVEKKMRIIPFYVDIQLRVGLGMVTNHPANWNNMREMYSRALSNVQLDAVKGPTDVLVFSPDIIRQRMGPDVYDILMTAKNKKQEYVGLRPMEGLEHIPSGSRGKKKIPNVTVVFHPDGELENGSIWGDGPDSVLSTPSTIKKPSPRAEEEDVFYDSRDRDVSDIRFDTGHIVQSSSGNSPQDPDDKNDDNTVQLQPSTGDVGDTSSIKVDLDDAASSNVAPLENLKRYSSEVDGHAAQDEASNVNTETEVRKFNFHDEERGSPKFDSYHDSMYKVETLNAVSLKSDEAGERHVPVKSESNTRELHKLERSPGTGQRRATIIHLRETSSDPNDVMSRSTINLHEPDRYDAAPVRKANSYTLIPGSTQPISIPLGNSRNINIASLPLLDQPQYAGSVPVDSTFSIVGAVVQDQVPVDNEPMVATTNGNPLHSEPVLTQGQPLVDGIEDHTLHIEIQSHGQEWTIDQDSPARAKSISPEHFPKSIPANYSETALVYERNGPHSESDYSRNSYSHTEPHREVTSKPRRHRVYEQSRSHEPVPIDERMEPHAGQPLHSGQPMRYDPDYNEPRQPHTVNEQPRSRYAHEPVSVDERMEPHAGQPLHSGQPMRYDSDYNEPRQPHTVNEQPRSRYAHEPVPVDERMQPQADQPSHSGQPMRYEEYFPRSIPANYSETAPVYEQNGSHPKADLPRHSYSHTERRREVISKPKPKHQGVNDPRSRQAHKPVPIDERIQPQADQPSHSGQPMRYDPDYNAPREPHRGHYDYVDSRAAPRRGTRHNHNYENLIPPSSDRERDLNPNYDYDHLENPYMHDSDPRYHDDDDILSAATSLSQMSHRDYGSEEYGIHDRVRHKRAPQTEQHRPGDYHHPENVPRRRNPNDRKPRQRPLNQYDGHNRSHPRDTRKAPSRYDPDEQYDDERPTHGSSVRADRKHRERDEERRQYARVNRDEHYVPDKKDRQRPRHDERTRAPNNRHKREHRDSTSWQDSDSVLSELSELARKGPLVEGVDLFDKFPETNTRSSSHTSHDTKYSPTRMSYTDTSKIDSYAPGLSGYDKYSSILSANKLSTTSRSTVPITSIDRDLNFRTSSATHGRDLLTRTIPVQNADTRGGSTNYSNTRRHTYQRTDEPRYRNRSRYFSTESDRSGPSTTSYQYSPLFSNRQFSGTFDNEEKVPHQLDRYPDFKEPREKIRDIKMNPSDSSDCSSESGSSGVRAMYDLQNLKHTSNIDLDHVDSEMFSQEVAPDPQNGSAHMTSRADDQPAETEEQIEPIADSGNTESAMFKDNSEMYDTSISSIIASSKAEAMQELDRMTRDDQREESRRKDVERAIKINTKEFSNSQRSSRHSTNMSEYPSHSEPRDGSGDYTGSTGSLNRNSLVREQGWVKYRASDNQTAPSSGIKSAVARANSIESRDDARNELKAVLRLRSSKIDDGELISENSDTINNFALNMQMANENPGSVTQESQRYSTDTSHVTVTRNSEVVTEQSYARTTAVDPEESSNEQPAARHLKSGSVSSLRQVYKTPPSSIRQKTHLSVANPEASHAVSHLEELFVEPPNSQRAGGGKFVMRFKEGNG